MVLGFCTGTKSFIGLTCDIVAFETACFRGEIAFAVALDLAGRAVTTGLVTVVGREAVGRVDIVLVVAVAVLAVVADRVGRVVEVEATVSRSLVMVGF